MIREIYGKKIGMTQMFNEKGDLIPMTLIEMEPVYILEKVVYPTKIKAKIGCFKIKENRIGKVKKPIRGYFNKLGVSPYKLIKEVEIEKDTDFSFDKAEDISTEVSESTGGEDSFQEEQKVSRDPREIGVEIFSGGDIVNTRAKTKGRGFAGGMKRHHWHGQPKSHGSTTHRRIGSAGASAYPSKIIKGLNMPGHMGSSFRTIKKLKVLKVDKDKSILFIEGSIPGSRGTIVCVKKVDSVNGSL